MYQLIGSRTVALMGLCTRTFDLINEQIAKQPSGPASAAHKPDTRGDPVEIGSSA